MFGDKCPRCGKGPMVTDNSTGEMFCGNCGFVVTERIEETGPEWRAFSKEEHEDRSRAGVPTSLAMHDMGLATIIGPVDKDASGKPLSASMKSTGGIPARAFQKKERVYLASPHNASTFNGPVISTILRKHCSHQGGPNHQRVILSVHYIALQISVAHNTCQWCHRNI